MLNKESILRSLNLAGIIPTICWYLGLVTSGAITLFKVSPFENIVFSASLLVFGSVFLKKSSEEYLKEVSGKTIYSLIGVTTLYAVYLTLALPSTIVEVNGETRFANALETIFNISIFVLIGLGCEWILSEEKDERGKFNTTFDVLIFGSFLIFVTMSALFGDTRLSLIDEQWFSTLIKLGLIIPLFLIFMRNLLFQKINRLESEVLPIVIFSLYIIALGIIPSVILYFSLSYKHGAKIEKIESIVENEKLLLEQKENELLETQSQLKRTEQALTSLREQLKKKVRKRISVQRAEVAWIPEQEITIAFLKEEWNEGESRITVKIKKDKYDILFGESVYIDVDDKTSCEFTYFNNNKTYHNHWDDKVHTIEIDYLCSSK